MRPAANDCRIPRSEDMRITEMVIGGLVAVVAQGLVIGTVLI
jgi:hypothetical protein